MSKNGTLENGSMKMNVPILSGLDQLTGAGFATLYASQGRKQ